VADINVSSYTIGDNTYHYRDHSMQEQIDQLDENKVDKNGTDSLMSEEEHNKLEGIEDGAQVNPIVDDELSNLSENPVQNKVVTEAIEDLTLHALGHATTADFGQVKIDGVTLITDENGILHASINTGTNVSITPEDIPEPNILIATYSIDGVDGELYAPQGGGGTPGVPAQKVTLYTNSGTTADNIALNDAYDNYDILYFTLIQSSSSDKVVQSIETSKLGVTNIFQLNGGSASNNWIRYSVASDKLQFELQNSPVGVYVSSVVGMLVGGSRELSALEDVDVTTASPSNGQVLKYNSTSQKWENANESGYTLPIAGANTLGGIKVGQNLSIDQNGVLNATGGSSVTDLDDLSDVTISSAADGQVLKYNNGTWVNANEAGGASTLSDLSDVDVTTTSPTSGQVLKFDGTNWVNANESGGTITDVQVDGVSVVTSGVAEISTMTGAGASAAGSKGLVPAPASGDNEKFLRGDGTWQTVGGGGGSSTLAGLTDVDLTSLTNGQILQYNSSDQEWQNVTPASLSGYVTAGAAAGSTVGQNATAEGYDVYSTDYQSHAEGEGTSALAGNAHAEGAGTSAAGVRSHAEGDRTRALAANCHSEGYATWATNNSAHAEGEETTASGFCSHAEGQYTNANYGYAHAEGYSTIAAEAAAHSEGGSTYAAGEASHAEGSWTTALGYRAHSEGYYTSAKGDNSHAEGYKTTAYGNSSHAEGYSTCAHSDYSHVEGQENKTNGGASHVEGYSNTVISGNNSHAEGRFNQIINATAAHVEGSSCTVISGIAHAEGTQTYATGEGAHSEGRWTKALQSEAHAEGFRTCAAGLGSHAEGGRTSGYNIEGTFAIGMNSHSEGLFTSAVGNHSHAGGFCTCSVADCSTAIGKYNVPHNDYAFVVGNGTDNNTRSNAFAVKWNGDLEAKGSILDLSGCKTWECLCWAGDNVTTGDPAAGFYHRTEPFYECPLGESLTDYNEFCIIAIAGNTNVANGRCLVQTFNLSAMQDLSAIVQQSTSQTPFSAYASPTIYLTWYTERCGVRFDTVNNCIKYDDAASDTGTIHINVIAIYAR